MSDTFQDGGASRDPAAVGSGMRERREQRRRKLTELPTSPAMPKGGGSFPADRHRTQGSKRSLFGLGPRSKLDAALVWGLLAILLLAVGALVSYWASIHFAAEDGGHLYFIAPDAPRDSSRHAAFLMAMRTVGYTPADSPGAAHLIWTSSGSSFAAPPPHGATSPPRSWVSHIPGAEVLLDRVAREEMLRTAAAISAHEARRTEPAGARGHDASGGGGGGEWGGYRAGGVLEVERPATWLLARGEGAKWVDAHRAATHAGREAWWALEGPAGGPAGREGQAATCAQPVAEWGDAEGGGAATATEVPRDVAVVGGRRLTLRSYVLVTSRLPLRAYIHRRSLGLVARADPLCASGGGGGGVRSADQARRGRLAPPLAVHSSKVWVALGRQGADLARAKVWSRVRLITSRLLLAWAASARDRPASGGSGGSGYGPASGGSGGKLASGTPGTQSRDGPASGGSGDGPASGPPAGPPREQRFQLFAVDVAVGRHGGVALLDVRDGAWTAGVPGEEGGEEEAASGAVLLDALRLMGVPGAEDAAPQPLGAGLGAKKRARGEIQLQEKWRSALEGELRSRVEAVWRQERRLLRLGAARFSAGDEQDRGEEERAPCG
ncbi:hypothetical protein T484DRAFT_1926778, partial [Baffinella frigidus]